MSKTPNRRDLKVPFRVELTMLRKFVKGVMLCVIFICKLIGFSCLADEKHTIGNNDV